MIRIHKTQVKNGNGEWVTQVFSLVREKLLKMNKVQVLKCIVPMDWKCIWNKFSLGNVHQL